MSKPMKVLTFVSGVLAALILGVVPALTVGSGVANANPGWCDTRYASCQEWNNDWHGNGWYGSGWRDNDCGRGCGPYQDHNQMVWKDGPPGRPGVFVEFWKVNWRWCPDGRGEYYLVP